MVSSDNFPVQWCPLSLPGRRAVRHVRRALGAPGYGDVDWLRLGILRVLGQAAAS